MITDKKVVEWKNHIKESLFDVFNEDKRVNERIVVARVDDKGDIESIMLDTSEVPPELMRSAVQNVLERLQASAYVVIGMRHVVLFKPEEEEEMLVKHREAGSVKNMDNAKEVLLFAYETKVFSSIELYEVIRFGDDAVLSKTGMLDSIDIDSEYFFTGMLRSRKHNDISEFNLN